VSENHYKQMNQKQEQIIQQLLTIARQSVDDLSLSLISKAQDNLEYVKNPLSVFD